MPVETRDVEKLVRLEGEKTSQFFGTEVPQPGVWLFEAEDRIKRDQLFKVAPFYLPQRQLVEGVTYPGLKWPLNPWIYEQIRNGNLDEDADQLPGAWVLLDVTPKPNYDNGRQMYHDTKRFKEMLAGLREQNLIEVSSEYRHISEDSRFAISADKIDGRGAVVARAVAEILGIQSEQVTTLPYATFNYVGNRDHPEWGQANTAEWLRNTFEHGRRPHGGHSLGGLSDVLYWLSDYRFDIIGFRLQVGPPSNT
ncbi:hypothetical protein HYS92_02940 [Candidatus Daviesbacteria bacterium]|nr:hypothetical protein [Candidatus Daviesbacteria bacterium]